MSNLLAYALSMSEPHWRKRMREAKARKRKGGFYSRTAGKGWVEVKEVTFWGNRGLQKRFGKVDGEKLG